MISSKLKLNEKGFVLVELIVAMAISSIVLIMMIGIFFVVTTITRDIYNSNEIQHQGHFIIDFISSMVMPSSEIESVFNYTNNSYIESDQKIELGEIKLIDNSLSEEERHIFSIQKDPKMEGKSIRYGKMSSAKIEAGNYIKAIYLKPLPDGNTYKEARGVELTLVMKKGRSNMEISKSIYFRN